MNPLYIAASGMVAQQQRVDVIANNLANMNTTGYQRRRASFNDLVYEDNKRPNNTHSRASGIVPSGVKAGLGVRTASFYRVVEQGNLKQTGNPFDLAVQGSGYIPVTLASGDTGYTRAGAFQLNEQGQLVTHDGLTVGGGIAIPQGAQGRQNVTVLQPSIRIPMWRQIPLWACATKAACEFHDVAVAIGQLVKKVRESHHSVQLSSQRLLDGGHAESAQVSLRAGP